MSKEIKNIKPRRFTCGDVHGGYLALVQVLERCGFDYENDLLITLGDITDGRSDVYNLVEELLRIKNRIDIKGNHDEFFIDFLKTGVHSDNWSQGGLATARSYANAIGLDLKVQTTRTRDFRGGGVSQSHILNLNVGDIPQTHIDFFNKQISYYKDEDNNIFVHGGINRFQPIRDQLPYHMMWDRKLFNQAMSAKASNTKLRWDFEEVNRVFIGHTTTECWGTTEPIKAANVWNLDTGAGGKGKLTIMNIDTEEYFQSDSLAELYPNEDNSR